MYHTAFDYSFSFRIAKLSKIIKIAKKHRILSTLTLTSAKIPIYRKHFVLTFRNLNFFVIIRFLRNRRIE